MPLDRHESATGSVIIKANTTRRLSIAAVALSVAAAAAFAWIKGGTIDRVDTQERAAGALRPWTALPLDHAYRGELQSKKRNALLKPGASVDPVVFLDINRVGVVSSAGLNGFASQSTANQAAQFRQVLMFYRGPAQNREVPADTHMAVSAATQEKVIVTNSAYGVWGNSLIPSYEKLARDFWLDAATGNPVTPDTNHPFDPVVYRDEKFDRWVIVALDGSGPTSNLLVAVSRGGSSGSGWYRRKFNAVYDGRWLDRIHIAGNATHLVVTGNYFAFPGGPNPVDTQTLGAAFIFSKAALFSSSTLPSPTMFKLSASDVVAADDPDQARSNFVLMSNDLAQPVTRMSLLAPSGNSWALRPLAVVGAAWQPIPTGFVQQPHGYDVKADSRLLDCVRRNGSVYCVFMAYSSLSNQVPLAFWMQWSENGRLLQYGDSAGSAGRFNRASVPHWAYYPTLAVDANSNLAITFTADDIYPLGATEPDRVELGIPGMAADPYVAMLWRSPQTPRGGLEAVGQQIGGGKRISHGEFTVVLGSGPNPLPSDRSRAGDYASMSSLAPGAFYAAHGVGTGGVLTVPVGSGYQTVDWITQQVGFSVPSGNRPPDVVLRMTQQNDASGTLDLVAENLSSEVATAPLVSAVADGTVKISAMSAGGKPCAVVNDSYRECLLSNLPGKSTTAVTVTYSGTGSVAVEFAALTGDAKPTDNIVKITVANTTVLPTPPPGTQPTTTAASAGGCTAGHLGDPFDPMLLALAALAAATLARRGGCRHTALPTA